MSMRGMPLLVLCDHVLLAAGAFDITPSRRVDALDFCSSDAEQEVAATITPACGRDLEIHWRDDTEVTP